MARVPIIDLAPFANGGRDQVVEQVRRACADVGFLVITGHGIAPELLAQMSAVSRAFFDLPEPVKAVHRHPERGARYVPLASESVAASLDLVTPPDLKEAYSVYRLDTQEWPPRPAALREPWQEYYRALAARARTPTTTPSRCSRWRTCPAACRWRPRPARGPTCRTCPARSW